MTYKGWYAIKSKQTKFMYIYIRHIYASHIHRNTIIMIFRLVAHTHRNGLNDFEKSSIYDKDTDIKLGKTLRIKPASLIASKT